MVIKAAVNTKYIFLGGVVWLLLTLAEAHAQRRRVMLTIAFGSCAQEYKPQPVLRLASQKRPDYFIFLGDNIYADTRHADTLKAKYARLAAKAEFKQLQSSSRLLATWDDHDYGENDAGRHYPLKEISKSIFLDFWKEPQSSPRRLHAGIYHAEYLALKPLKVQLILLDLRTFRDNLRLAAPGQRMWRDKQFFYDLDYLPYETADSTLLGEEQWQWLEKQLLLPADLRLIASSTQFGITFNGYESWANFPHEQERFFSLIRKTRAEGVIFLSGDVHYAEISKIHPDGIYPLYDFTSSGITSTWDFATPNGNRVAGPVMENNFGMMHILAGKDPAVHFYLYDVENRVRIEKILPLSDLKMR